MFLGSVLDIDEEAVFLQFVKAEQHAFNLAVNASVYNDKTVPVIVGKAFREAKAVALEGNVLTSETAGEILGKAQRAAQEIKSQIVEEAPQ